MENKTPFKLINPHLDSNPAYECSYPDIPGNDSPVWKSMYLQMVPTMCGQDIVDTFFMNLGIKEESSATFVKLKELIDPAGTYADRIQLADYLLGKYRIIEHSKLDTAEDYAAWFIDVLETLYGKVPVPEQEGNTVWKAVVDRVHSAPVTFSMLGLFTRPLSRNRIGKTLMEQVPAKTVYSKPGMPEKAEQLARRAAYSAKIAVLANAADLCERIFMKGEHEPDPDTISEIVSDIITPSCMKPHVPGWVKTEPHELPSEPFDKADTAFDKIPGQKETDPAQAPGSTEANVPEVPAATPSASGDNATTPQKTVSETAPGQPEPAQGHSNGTEPAPGGEVEDVVTVDEDPEPAGPESPEPEEHGELAGQVDDEERGDDEDLAGIITSDLDTATKTDGPVSVDTAETHVDREEPPEMDIPGIYHTDVAPGTRRPTVPQKVLMEIYSHAGTTDQIKEAVHMVEQDIADNTPNAQFLSRYVPGVTQEIIKDILVNRTASGKYINRQMGKPGTAIPHTNLSGGTTFTSPVRSRTIGPVEVPPGFTQENSSVLWDEPVITTMGFPFINFGAPEIYTILKDKDETKVKKAYKKLKAQLKKVGLDSPIKVLKDFKHAKGVRCALNRITVDADELLAEGNADVIASVYPRVSVGMRSAIGSVSLTRDFIVEMYKVLSPTKGARIYMDALGMGEAEYADTLNRDGKPPLYIFIPKEQLAFTKAPAGFIARLLTSGNKPTLVEARIGTHSGGFVMPFKTTRLLFSEI